MISYTIITRSRSIICCSRSLTFFSRAILLFHMLPRIIKNEQNSTNFSVKNKSMITHSSYVFIMSTRNQMLNSKPQPQMTIIWVCFAVHNFIRTEDELRHDLTFV
jgi:hypothetical protein